MKNTLYCLTAAIATSLVMAFSFSAPLISGALFALLNTLRYVSDARSVRLFLAFILGVFTGSCFVMTLDMKIMTVYTGLSHESIVRGEAVVLRDSRYNGRGYITPVRVRKVSSESLTAGACFTMELTSWKKRFRRGEVLDLKELEVRGEPPWFSSAEKVGVLFWDSQVNRLRGEFRKRLEGVLDKMSSGGFFKALLTGDKSSLEPGIRETFQKAGCSHILALSGFHTGAVSLLFYLILRLFFSTRPALFISLLFLALYIFLAGFSPSLFRAGIMYSLAVCFSVKGYRVSPLFSLSLSFFIQLMFFPEDFYSLSFQLSFLALLGLFLLGRELDFLMEPFLPEILRKPLCASLGAVGGTLPLILSVFGTVYPAGIPAGIVVSPLVSLYLWVSIIQLVFSPFSIPFSLADRVTCTLYLVIKRILEFFSGGASPGKSPLIYFIIVLIPVILFVLNTIRRRNARRFNIKFKL